MTAVLKVVKGKSVGKSFYLVKGRRLILGNDPSCDIQLGEVGVSRRHFAVEWDGKSATVTDLGSSNGTYVNGERVLSTGLLEDDMLVAGQVVLQFGFQKGTQEQAIGRTIVMPTETHKRRAGDILKRLQASERSFIDSVVEAYAGEKLDRLQRALATVYSVGNILNAADGLDVTLHRVTHLVGEHFKCDAAVVFLRAKEGVPLTVKGSWFRDPARKSEEIPVSRTILEKAANEGLSVLTNDPVSDERFSASRSICQYNIRCALCAPVQAQKKLLGALYVDYTSGTEDFSEGDLDLLTAIGKQVGVAVERIKLEDELGRMSLNAMRALAAAIEAKDEYTRGHSDRVSRICVLIGRQLGLSESQLRILAISGTLHDVGKIGIPEKILQKPSRLTDEEYELMKRHPTIGESILREFEGHDEVCLAIRHHHERSDGKGYPDRLPSEQIPLGAKIIAVADAWDTMVTERSYKRAMPDSEAISELRKHSGTQFDPKVVQALCDLYGQGQIQDIKPKGAQAEAPAPP